MAIKAQGVITLIRFNDAVVSAWANSPDGMTDFTKEDPVGSVMQYIGVGGDGSTDPSKYQWQLNPDWIKANYDTQLADKVSSDEYLDALGQMVGTEEYEAFKKQTETLRQSYEAFVANDYTAKVNALEKRATGLEVQLDNKIADFEFLRTHIKMGEEGLEIGSDDSSLKMVLDKDKLVFSDGGTAVAYFTNQSFYINRGAIVESLQVGSHKMTKINADSTVFQFVGG